MVGTKKKNVYRKKRKGKPFSGVQKQAKRVTETTEAVDPAAGTSRGCSDSESAELSASRKKVKFECSADDSFSDLSESGDEKIHQGQGYRLIDLGRFSSTLSEAHVCEEGERCF